MSEDGKKKSWAERIGLGTELKPSERREVLEGMFAFGKGKQAAFVRRMWALLVLSTIIATSGLLSDSAAVVIGAMLVAPMMRPVMAAAAAITLAWMRRLVESITLVIAMAFVAIGIAAAMTWLGPDMIFIPEQVLARTRPTYFDLVIALAAGAAGAYTMTRKETSAIPGVAMAVALLPPLASSGILLVFSEFDLSLKALVLFVTNFFAMILAGTATFLVTGMGSSAMNQKFSGLIKILILVFVLLVGGISVPLFYYSSETWYNADYAAKKSPVVQDWLEENSLKMERIFINEEEKIVYLTVSGPHPPLSLESLYNGLQEKRSERKDRRDFTIKAQWIQSTLTSWPPPKREEMEMEHSAVNMIPDEVLDRDWYWVRTQYSDEDWTDPDRRVYRIRFEQEDDLSIEISCKTLRGTYSYTADYLSIEVKKPKLFNRAPCDNELVDNNYTSDLSRVVDIRHEEGDVILELNNNAGFMVFSSSP